MRIDILTLFPDTVNAVLHESIIGRAAKKGIVDINCVQIRDFTENKQKQVDDYPYGGGFGCVMMAQPLKSCLDHVMECASGLRSRVVYMSPQGKPYTQETARRLNRDYDHLVLVCGHYEGVDERFIEQCVDEEISLGDFVLTGGEIAAMAVADSVCRLVPGVLADEQCYTGESHWDGLLEYPQYTRPENWEGRAVPEILLNGDHARIEHWRRKKQLERTRDKRPDMFAAFAPETDEDKKLLRELEKERERKKLTEPVSYRLAVSEDIPRILEIVQDAREARLLELRYIDGKSDWIDLRCAEEITLKKGEFKLIPLGVGMKLPKGYEAHVVPRSSTFKNFGIIQTNHMGVIDYTYSGDNDQWFMPVYAVRDTEIHVNDRVCQFRVMENQPAIEFDEALHLDAEDRGGFGSTGKA